MKVWFTSDTHFGHKLVADLRGFASPADHDEHLIWQWNRLVQPEDIVWHLGDVGLGSEEYILECVRQLHGHKQLVWGNHDKVFGGRPNAWKHQQAWLEVFETIQAFAVARPGLGRDVLLSHFPYEGDHTERDRELQWRLSDHGEWLVHGHLHCTEKLTADRSVHVGLDAWDFQPVPEAALRVLISRQQEVLGE